MAVVVILPKQGQSVESCIITEIKKKKGDTVKKGEVLFSYETDKASFEEESPIDGVVLESFYNENDEVPVLLDMMVIGQPGDEYAAMLQGGAPVESAAPVAAHAAVIVEAKPTVVETQNTKHETQNTKHETSFVSPRAKNLAEKEALNASELTGSGPAGRVIEKDVLAALETRGKLTPLAKAVSVAEGIQPQGAGSGLAGAVKSTDLLPPVNAVYGVDYEDKKLSNMRKLIAKAMHTSLQNSAQLTHHLGADARKIQSLRKKAKKAFEAGTLSANLTINDFVCFAVIKALKKFPNVNSHFTGDAMRLFNKVHLGLAVDTERGLMVPAVRNADDLSIIGLSNQMKEVANSCKKGAIAPELLSAE
ncbi:MAG: 2-oxo acid dehydrogenase subunit E2, partial [Paludibacter sp.]